METKFTKGEWMHDSYSVWTESKTEFIEGNIICEAPTHARKSMQNWEANAKLIAAAPDLLAALKICYASLCTYGKHPIVEAQVESAIKKATE